MESGARRAGRHRDVPEPPARGKAAVVQWVLLIVFGAACLCLGVALLVLLAESVTGWIRSERSWWSEASADFSEYGWPFSFGLGVCILLGILARNRVYRLLGKNIPQGSGGGGFP